MALDDIDIVILVEGDIHRLVEGAVPFAVVPGLDGAAFAQGEERFALGVQLPDHIEEGIRQPDIALTVHAQPMRADHDIGIEGADEFVVLVELQEHRLRIAAEKERMALRR